MGKSPTASHGVTCLFDKTMAVIGKRLVEHLPGAEVRKKCHDPGSEARRFGRGLGVMC